MRNTSHVIVNGTLRNDPQPACLRAVDGGRLKLVCGIRQARPVWKRAPRSLTNTRGRLLCALALSAAALLMFPVAARAQAPDATLAILARMDQAGNGDGKLDKKEIPSGAERFVSRVLKDAGMEPSASIELSELTTRWSPPPRPLESRVVQPSLKTLVNRALHRLRRVHDAHLYAKSLLQIYDEDGSGALERSEWARLSKSWSDVDRDADGQLTVAEITVQFEVYHRQASQTPPPPPIESYEEPPQPDSSATREVPDDKRGAPAPAAAAAELPAWLRDKDANRDGQIQMLEFETRWSAARVAAFRRYDINGDGIITPPEAHRAEPPRE